jgi:hypothetical protein
MVALGAHRAHKNYGEPVDPASGGKERGEPKLPSHAATGVAARTALRGAACSSVGSGAHSAAPAAGVPMAC